MLAHPADISSPESQSVSPTSQTASDATAVVLAEPSCVAVEAQAQLAPGAPPMPPGPCEKRKLSPPEIEKRMLAAILKRIEQTSNKRSKPTVNRSKLYRLLFGAAVMATIGVWALMVTRKLGPEDSPTCQSTGTDSSSSMTSMEEIEAAALIADDWRYLLKMTRAYGIICLASSGLQLLSAALVLCGCLGGTSTHDDTPEEFCCGCLEAIVGIFMLVYIIIFLVAFGKISDPCEGHQDFEAVSSIRTFIMVVNIFIPASVCALCCCFVMLACVLASREKSAAKKHRVLPLKPRELA